MAQSWPWGSRIPVKKVTHFQIFRVFQYEIFSPVKQSVPLMEGLGLRLTVQEFS